MRYELSLTGGTFAPAVEDFDRKLLLLLDMMRSRGLDEGDVTLKISVEMVQAHPMDEDGVVHDLLCPVFKYETAYRTAQSGLRPAELMAAIDYAVSVVGFEGVARDYWPHVQAEARRIWREMRAAGFLDRQENPSP